MYVLLFIGCTTWYKPKSKQEQNEFMEYFRNLKMMTLAKFLIVTGGLPIWSWKQNDRQSFESSITNIRHFLQATKITQLPI
jgi:hypothetical protein